MLGNGLLADIDFIESRIRALEEDISIFGPAGDDLTRLAGYRAKLIELQRGVMCS